MKILKFGSEVHYLQSVNLYGGGKNVFLVFRQEFKYQFSRNVSDIYNYKKILLILWFDDADVATKHYQFLKENFLDDTLSIDILGENHLEFIGGLDYEIKVSRYTEQLLDQTIDDWIDRYHFLSNEIMQRFAQESIESNLIRTIKEKVNLFKYRHSNNETITDFSDEIIQLIEEKLNTKHERPYNPRNDLLSEINKKLTAISDKIDKL